jgi:DNA-binding response OmpR family regulator
MGRSKVPVDPVASPAEMAASTPDSAHVRVRDPQMLHAVLQGLAALGLRAIIGNANGGATANCVLCVVELPDGGRNFSGLLNHPHCARVLAVLKAREADALDAVLLRGVDDFILSPWHEREFLWRLERLMDMGPRVSTSELSLGPITLERRRHRALVDGRPVGLTKTQFQLLSYLMSNADRVVSRSELMERVWGSRHGASASLIGTHMHSLRRRLGSAGDLIVTVRGVGYMLSDPSPR